jgi:hypothetical protein
MSIVENWLVMLVFGDNEGRVDRDLGVECSKDVTVVGGGIVLHQVQVERPR